MLGLALLVECKDGIVDVLFMVAIDAALVMFLVTTRLLCLLEMVLELVDLCCKDPNFFFKGRELALLVGMSYL